MKPVRIQISMKYTSRARDLQSQSARLISSLTTDFRWEEILKNIKVRWIAGGVLVFFVLWIVFVHLSGSGRYWFGDGWDFELTGQLGDSFGVVSAVMTSLAAIFTYQTLMDTRRLAASERFELERRENERSESDARRDAELTFFRLLEARVNVLNDVRIGDLRCIQATEAMVDFIKEYNKYNPKNRKEDKILYNETYADKRNDLGHYFRYTYHIVLHAAEHMKSNSYNHLRFLRAQMSNSELVLLALNCAYGEGEEKFKLLVERYALLHNIDHEDRNRFKLDDHFKARAFGLPARKFRMQVRPVAAWDVAGNARKSSPVRILRHPSRLGRRFRDH